MTDSHYGECGMVFIEVCNNTTSGLDCFLTSAQSTLCNTSQFQCSFLWSYHAFICASFELPLTPNRIASDYIEYRGYSLVDIHCVECWMKSNSMLLNISKSKVMRFGTMDLGDMKIQLGGNLYTKCYKLELLTKQAAANIYM
uniref:Uncharacterized protein n=1 Tax=Glossina austeni TaxID=7395 RepID=A0A1A9VII4_GLOAU